MPMSAVRVRLAVALLSLVALTAGASGSASAAPAALPAHIYAPYFETWTADSITQTAHDSGARYFTLACLETLGKSSCTLAWNGDKTQTIADGRYLSDIAPLRALGGGDVIPSFGGWSADQGGTEIADSCKDVNAIAPPYQNVIPTHPLP